MDNTPWTLFRRTATSSPDAEALVDARREARFTYEELYDHACGFVGALSERGVGRGDVYATLLNNGVEQTAAIVAPTALGAVSNTVNTRQSPDAITYILTDADSRLLVFDEANRESVEAIRMDLGTVDQYLYLGTDPPPWADDYETAVDAHVGAAPPTPALDPDDPLALLYTSGTTGQPKGCLYTAGGMVEMLIWLFVEGRHTADDRFLLVAPQAHAAGNLGGGTLPVFRGGAVVTLPGFDPVDVLETMERESITKTLVVPSMLRALLAAGPERFDTGSLSELFTVGSPLPPDLAKRVADAFELDYFGNLFGSTEAAFVFERNVLEDLDTATSPGTAALNVETRVVALDGSTAGDPTEVCDAGETGELIVRSPYGMDRYLNRPEATETAFRDGWYYTGDLGSVDEYGRFWPEGRKSNTIISGGINVAPANVEEVLRENPHIADVAVVGVPDETWGERVVACVVTDDEHLTEADLLAWCEQRSDLAAFQRPKSVTFHEELPYSATMKVQKYKLATFTKHQRNMTSTNLRAEIEEADRAFERNFGRQDAAGMGRLYTEDGQLLPPGTGVVSGQDDIARFWQGIFDMGVADAQLETVELEDHGDTAIEIGRFTLSDADEQPVDHGTFIVVWKDGDEGWQLHRDIWNSNGEDEE